MLKIMTIKILSNFSMKKSVPEKNQNQNQNPEKISKIIPNLRNFYFG